MSSLWAARLRIRWQSRPSLAQAAAVWRPFLDWVAGQTDLGLAHEPVILAAPARAQQQNVPVGSTLGTVGSGVPGEGSTPGTRNAQRDRRRAWRTAARISTAYGITPTYLT